MNTKQIQVGSRIYYRGDMANNPGWFTVTGLRPATKYSPEQVELMEVEGEFRSKVVPAFMVSHKDSGNGSTRFVTERAYNELRAERMAEMVSWAARTRKVPA